VLKAMLVKKLKIVAGLLLTVALTFGTGGLVYQTAGAQDTTEKRGATKPRSELEALRHENELLKLNLEVVLEKVKAQEAELRALKKQDATRQKTADERVQAELDQKRAEDDAALAKEKVRRIYSGLADLAEIQAEKAAKQAQAQEKTARVLEERLLQSTERAQSVRANQLRAIEGALKVLRETPGKEAKRAADELEQAVKKLKEQSK
jgi:hypothetical protein